MVGDGVRATIGVATRLEHPLHQTAGQVPSRSDGPAGWLRSANCSAGGHRMVLCRRGAYLVGYGLFSFEEPPHRRSSISRRRLPWVKGTSTMLTVNSSGTKRWSRRRCCSPRSTSVRARSISTPATPSAGCWSGGWCRSSTRTTPHRPTNSRSATTTPLPPRWLPARRFAHLATDTEGLYTADFRDDPSATWISVDGFDDLAGVDIDSKGELGLGACAARWVPPESPPVAESGRICIAGLKARSCGREPVCTRFVA